MRSGPPAAEVPAERPPRLRVLLASALGAVLLAWVLAFAFVQPLTTGPIERGVAEQVIDPALGYRQVARAEEFQSGQRKIAVGSLLLELALLGAAAFWRPPALRRRLAGLSRRPVAGAALVGGLLALLLAVSRIPLGLLALHRGQRYGLVSQGIGDWLIDLAIGAAISMILAAAGAAIAMVIWRRLGRRFWIAASGVAIGFVVISVWLWPVVVAPAFNNFKPLPPGPVRSDVLRLAARAGVDPGRVLEVDASRRSNGLNAYVVGVGPTRRTVIYDNAIRDLNRAGLRSLIAHELTHVESNDLVRGLLYAILIIPLGALTLQVATRIAVGRSGDDPSGPGVIPALALGLTVVTLLLTVPGNWVSRQVEANADAGAITLAGSRGLVDLQIELARKNLTDPDPPPVWQFLFGTHPTTVDRIGMAEAMSGSRIWQWGGS